MPILIRLIRGVYRISARRGQDFKEQRNIKIGTKNHARSAFIHAFRPPPPNQILPHLLFLIYSYVKKRERRGAK